MTDEGERGTLTVRVGVRFDEERARRVCGVRIHRPEQAPLVLPLDGSRTTLFLGRGEQADVRLRGDARVSRIHGMLRKDGDEWCFIDLGSANGSFAGSKADAVDDQLQEALRLPSGQSTPLGGVDAIIFSKNSTWLEPLFELPSSSLNRGTLSAAGRRFEEALHAAAPSSLAVFLLGPSGSGKTWAARVLHERSGRSGPFVAINCARLPTETAQLHSELLGHVKGAYTDAKSEREGRFFEAHNGTLFLDEVESLSPLAQGFLLDLLEDSGQLLPLGATGRTAPRRPNVRIVSASKATLQRSALRADLAFRLAAEEHITVPRLAERREDIPGLVHHFLAASEKPVPVVTAEAMQALQSARWSGEVRELEGTIRVLSERARRKAGVIDAVDVEQRLQSVLEVHGEVAAFDPDETRAWRRPTLRVDLVSVPSGLPSLSEVSREVPREAPREAPRGASRSAREAPGDTPTEGPTAVGDVRRVEAQRLTRADIEKALAETGGNIDRAHRLLGVARNTLTSKMDRFGIPRPRPR